jgi:hypothetical protein
MFFSGSASHATVMKVVYIANIVVAGCIAFASISSPEFAARTVFSDAYQSTEVMRLVGCLWLGIAVLSIGGLFRPVIFAPVFALQLVYKGSWLLVCALPALLRNQPYPVYMACFFLVWVIVLPFVIPWATWTQHQKS